MKYNKEIAYENKRQAIETLGCCCVICKADVRGMYFGQIHFHHIDSATKESNMASLWCKDSLTIEKELVKTVLMCGQCHKEFHRRVGVVVTNQTLEDYLANR